MRPVRIVPCLLVLAVACGSSPTLVVQAVSDAGGAPVEGVRVQVNDLPWRSTDAAGEADFGRVEAPFTVRLHQSNTGSGFATEDVWELPGLEGHLVVVPVNGESLPYHWVVVHGAIVFDAGAAPPPGSPDPYVSYSVTPSRESYSQPADPGGLYAARPSWEGQGVEAFATVRAFAEDGGTPAHYLGFGATSLAVSEATKWYDHVEISLLPVAETRVTGTFATPDPSVTGAVQLLRLVFPDESSFSLKPRSADRGSIEATIPLVSASYAELKLRTEGPPQQGGNTWWTEASQRFAPESPPALDLDLPAPVGLVEPADHAEVSPDAVFRWSATPGSRRYALDATCTWTDGGGSHLARFRSIETAGTEVALPALPSLTLPPGASCKWLVRSSDGAGSLALPSSAPSARRAGSVERAFTIGAGSG